MTVLVRYFALLRELKGTSSERVELPDGSTAGALLEMLFPPGQLPPMKRALMVAVNGAYADLGAPLREGDEIVFVPPVSGGVDLLPFVALTREPIDVGALMARVNHPSYGAITTFQGLVRDHAEGRGVLRLHYEAYEEMALAQMRQVGEEIAARFGTSAVAMVHRLGTLELGEVAVAVAVGTGHREEGFAACRYAIDRLKETVPIWKKEFYADDDASWK